MKKRLRRLIVFAGALGVVMALNVGVALADHGANAPPFEAADAFVVPDDGTPRDAAALTPGDAPVGTALDPATGTHPGNNGAFVGIDNNPNCPLHYAP